MRFSSCPWRAAYASESAITPAHEATLAGATSFAQLSTAAHVIGCGVSAPGRRVALSAPRRRGGEVTLGIAIGVESFLHAYDVNLLVLNTTALSAFLGNLTVLRVDRGGATCDSDSPDPSSSCPAGRYYTGAGSCLPLPGHASAGYDCVRVRLWLFARPSERLVRPGLRSGLDVLDGCDARVRAGADGDRHVDAFTGLDAAGHASPCEPEPEPDKQHTAHWGDGRRRAVLGGRGRLRVRCDERLDERGVGRGPALAQLEGHGETLHGALQREEQPVPLAHLGRERAHKCAAVVLECGLAPRAGPSSILECMAPTSLQLGFVRVRRMRDAGRAVSPSRAGSESSPGPGPSGCQ